MKIKFLLNLATLGLAIAFTSGCAVTLQHGQFAGPITSPKGPIAINAQAVGMPHRIGSGTFTAFAIPIAPVTVNGDAGRELMVQVKAAMEHSGYSAQLVEKPDDAPGMPTLNCQVKDIGFKNYTYFFPLVFNWGHITMDSTVTTQDGRIIFYQRNTSKSGGAYDFNSTVNAALTRLLDEMITGMASADLKEPTGHVCPALRSADPSEVVRGLVALRRLNAPDAVPEMLPLLKREEPGVVRETCRTLGVLGNKDTIPSLEILVNDPRSKVRKDAQDAINLLNRTVAQTSLLLKSNDPAKVIAALHELVRLKATEAVPDILPLLKQSNPLVLCAACQTLAILGNKDTIPAIEPLVNIAPGAVDRDSSLALRLISVHAALTSSQYEVVRKEAQNAIDILRAKS